MSNKWGNMFKRQKKKYKLLEKESIVGIDGKNYEVHRIQALIDIPMHNVKAGDLGGYISELDLLDHEGFCWVGGNAIISKFSYRSSTIRGDALVTDNAIVTGYARGKAIVKGNAIVDGVASGECYISDDVKISQTTVEGNVTLLGKVVISGMLVAAYENGKIIIKDDVSIRNVHAYDEKGYKVAAKSIVAGADQTIEISGKIEMENTSLTGNCVLDGEFRLENADIKGDNKIIGTPRILPNFRLSGTNHISGKAIIPPSSHLHNITIDSGIFSYLESPEGNQSGIEAPRIPAESNEYVNAIKDIEAEYESYTTDIVKLIKYPAMVDSSIPEVAEFIFTLRMANRAIKVSNEIKIQELSEKLEMAFLRAENTVRTLVTSHLNEDKKKSLKTAEKMFKIACDDASPDPEKRLGFKAGLRSLEGVLDISDRAVENLKERVGILELEA